MSEYKHKKVIRCKVDLKKLGIENIFDLEDLYPDLFGYRTINQFNVAPVEEMEYIDYEFFIIGKYYKSVYRTCTA